MADSGYLKVLDAINQLPFNIGKKLLGDILNGQKTDSIIKNRLDKLECYGSMSYSKEELGQIIDFLTINKLVEIKSISQNKYWKVLSITEKGRQELQKPTMKNKNMPVNLEKEKLIVSEKEKELFQSFDFFLKKYNEGQKKAIISSSKQILCVAGAGSGKTSVLTKRIEMLTTFRGVNPEEILAITFTRKAKREMEIRLKNSPFCNGVFIDTFNSFCEKMLKKYNNFIYKRNVSVISYGEKIKLVNFALKKLGLSMERAVNEYFSPAQKKLKTMDELSRILVNDCFSIIDYYKNENQEIKDFSKDPALSSKDQEIAKSMFDLCVFVDKAMKKLGKRDFADQVVDCVELFRKNPEKIPKFEHILVDEYQDINSVQMTLLTILSPENMFCVGDPRQSIFGWRGSRIIYITGFKEMYPDSEIIPLTTNYRSSKPLVDMMNKAIKHMKLPDLESGFKENKKNISLLKFEDEKKEREFVVDQVKKSGASKKEIFVLARTNKMLLELAEEFKSQKIDFVLRSDEVKRPALDKENAITLATIHAIKGMEADNVFIVGCNTSNFPCRTSDHPVVDIIKNGYYDKEEEEKRLFYVGISRTKKNLTMTYTGKLTHFFNNDMKKIVGAAYEKSMSSYKTASNSSGDLLTALKSWRRGVALASSLPAYMVLSDAVIEAIVQAQPMSLDELESIKGIGAVKADKYGEEILRIIFNS